MRTILGVTLPFFALVLFGYIAARRRWVPTDAVPAFNGFLLFFAVPAMLFRFAANTPFREIVNYRFFFAWGLRNLRARYVTMHAIVTPIRPHAKKKR